jgi:hypothetical protein
MKKEKSQNQKIDIDIKHKESFNLLFTDEELDESLSDCKGLSPGSDDIQYEFLKKLDQATRLRLLSMYEKIRIEGAVPKVWRGEIVHP